MRLCLVGTLGTVELDSEEKRESLAERGGLSGGQLKARHEPSPHH